MRTLWSGFAAWPTCGNQPDSPGRMKECPHGVCRNYRVKPPVPQGDGVKTIPLGDGVYAYVDAADYEWLNQWHWRVHGGYAARHKHRKVVFMHREIMKPPPGKVTDHINGNKLDNTRANMRNITRKQNMFNKGKRVGTVSIYKGVSQDRESGKWYAEIRCGDAYRKSARFEDEAEAARAYDYMAVEVFGEFARLNFPEEWPAERRARAHAQWQKNSRKTCGKRKGSSKKGRRGAAREKPRTARRPKTKARR
jgi:hypothetical protein